MSLRRRGLVTTMAAFLAALLLAAAVLAGSLEDKVNEFELDNGMKFLVVERKEAPVAFMSIVFNVGSANEWPNVTGISHLLEHMMFKGTEMMGTSDYKKEIPYIEKTDELGEKSIELRKAIGEWRFEKFEELRKEVLATFTDADNEEVGTDKYLQNKLVVEKIRAMDSLPGELESEKYLINEGERDYLALYLEYLETWGEIVRLTDEQRSKFVVNNELWETYMNNGSRMLNAGTSNDFTVYFVYLPSNRLELWMTMESDRMDTPVFREFWIERDVVMEERRLGENDPDDVLDEAFNSVAFTASPYKWPVVGWMSDLQTIDRKELAAYHKKYYAPNNATACIVGDVDVEQVKKMAKKYFGPIKAQEPPNPVETREPEQRGERRVVVENDANPALKIGWHKPVYPDPKAVVFDVITSVLSDGRTSRLYKSIYEEQQLTAEPPAAYTGPGDRYDNLMIISAEPRHPHTLDEVEKAIYVEVDKLKTEPVDERELQRIKNQLDANQVRQLGSNLGIAFTLLMGEIYMGDYKAMFRYIDMVKDVTPEDVMEVAQKYLTEQNRTVGWRVQVVDEKDESPPGSADEDEMMKYRAVLMQYIQSLPEDERMEIFQKFQTMRSEQEQMEYAKELIQRARDAGFIKEEKTEGE
jgi:predicted Zn-dependent peptidase